MADVGPPAKRSEPLFRQLMPRCRLSSPYDDMLAVVMNSHQPVQNLRDQLRETSIRLGDTKTENERLRYLYNSNESSSLTALRKSLAVAEQDVRKKQEEMEELRSQLVNQDDEQQVAAVQPRLVTMLRVQLNAIAHISKLRIFEPNLNIGEDVEELLQLLVKVNDGDLQELQKILEETTVLYDQISRGIIIRSLSDSWTMTEAIENEAFVYDDEEDTKEDSEWQAEMTAIQSLTTVKASFEEMLEEQRSGFQEEMEQLRKEHQKELDEEKAATRLALEAVRRAHEEELKQATTRKLCGEKDRDASRQNAMLEQMREELTTLSAAYSAKCVENAQLDERLSALMEQRAREGDSGDIQRLKRDLCLRDSQVAELQRRISAYERRGGDSTIVVSDIRFHSNPVISIVENVSEYLAEDVRRSLAVPVSERRKFFETIAEYSTPF
uniref:GRIP domain-containing protein n=1 Tax=Angiostrongylus cantonensis TaxID=6313 RepID=A0A158P6B5_ANGCA